MPQLSTTRVNLVFLICSWLESWCNLVRVIPTWFQFIGQILMHISPIWGISYIHFFWRSCVSFTCPWIILVFVELQWKCILPLNGFLKEKPIYFHAHLYNSWKVYNYVPVMLFLQFIPSGCYYELGKLSNHPIFELYPVCLCFLWFNITHLFHIHLYSTPNPNPLECFFILQISLF